MNGCYFDSMATKKKWKNNRNLKKQAPCKEPWVQVNDFDQSLLLTEQYPRTCVMIKGIALVEE